MQRFLLLTLVFFAGAGASAQQLNPEEYVYPLANVQRYYSANFGEMRSDHFHSGVDIKTDGVTGKPVLAVADGYVSRIAVSPTGYGLALYIAHPNGTTSVYGHLQSFREDIADYVRSERLRLHQNKVDLYCKAGQFPVKRGEQVALSGNSGSSFGPHLHFELRNSRTQRTLNVIAAGVIRPKDNIPPLILRLHYVELDTVRGIAVQRPMRSYEVRKTDSRNYTLAVTAPVPVGRRGYFILEASDRKNDVANTFGIYQARLSVDDRLLFEYRMDGFTFDQTRYCNSAAYYPLQLTSRNEAIRLAHQAGCIRDFHPTAVNGGLISAEAGERKEVRIEVQDDCNNRAQLLFQIEGAADEAIFHAEADENAEVIDYRRDFTTEIDDLQIGIPAGTLYESLFFRGERLADLPAGGKLPVLSPVYRVLDGTVPLHKAIDYSLRAEIPARLQPHAAMATRSRSGNYVCLGGRYRDGAMKLSARTTGELFIVADTIAPTIRPLVQQGADLSQAKEIAFEVTDNFSGIAAYTATIDGQWVIMDYQPNRKRMAHRFAESQLGRGEHTLRLEVTDGCQNRTVREIRFRR